MEELGFYFNKDKSRFKSKVQAICVEQKGYFYAKGRPYFSKHPLHGSLGLGKKVFVKIAPLEMTSWSE